MVCIIMCILIDFFYVWISLYRVNLCMFSYVSIFALLVCGGVVEKIRTKCRWVLRFRRQGVVPQIFNAPKVNKNKSFNI